MRADRLISLLLLLQQRGSMSASALARELEVSRRTVQRDIEALASAGMPVYAERGREGGYALLGRFTTDLTGLTEQEALALIAAGSPGNGHLLGMAPALASAMRKVTAAIPPAHRERATSAAERILVQPEEGWHPCAAKNSRPEEEHLDVVREAVLASRKLRIRYTARDASPRWRTVDPIGLVRVRGQWYLLAYRDDAERTYRLSRISAAQQLSEPVEHREGVDLETVWRNQRERFHATKPRVVATVRVRARRRRQLVDATLRAGPDQPDSGGWLLLEVEFADLVHAESVLWGLAPDAEALAPAELRRALADRANATAGRYG
ncbi:helix-turn-helix transcriptional regulator [Amycolatopsis sp. CA-230715]|uniref:helix-turn-helix transcriptional regulator n=1 Tax=Amycolatopsis sp. CA-230715 TaxID=2745196 RepID=UPI001C02A82D|nr:WYL domain-containing protein [Amycolatopsis sp. CA-230715]QWF83349.1 hypothetical protein HUW46_06789 [Amycolatopsis sp. CA-230715]